MCEYNNRPYITEKYNTILGAIHRNYLEYTAVFCCAIKEVKPFCCMGNKGGGGIKNYLEVKQN